MAQSDFTVPGNISATGNVTVTGNLSVTGTSPTPATVAGVRASTPIQAKQSYIGSNNMVPIYTSPTGFDTAIDSLSFTNLNASAASVKLYLTNKDMNSMKYVAVSYSSQTAASYSTDGISWTATTLPAALSWYAVAHGNSRFVAVALHTSAASSTDGVTWTLRTMPAGGNWQTLAFGAGKFVSMRYGTTMVAYSTDGVTWTTTTGSNNGGISLTYGNGLFVSLTPNSATGAYSTDGITWRNYTQLSQDWRGIAYGNGVFVSATAVNSTTAGSSTDGLTWTLRTFPSSYFLANVAAPITYGNGTFVAATGGTAIMTSTDGTTWTSRTLPSSSLWGAPVYGSGLFVLTSRSTGSSAVTTSTDGITWTLRSITQTATSAYYSAASGHVQDSELIYRNGSIAANGIAWIDANKADPIFVPAGYSLLAQSSVSPVNVQLSGERWVNV